jgi:Flp pilus assembly pilin Flp
LRLAAIFSGEKGQTALEYVLVIVLAVIAIILALQTALIEEGVAAGFDKVSGLISKVRITR